MSRDAQQTARICTVHRDRTVAELNGITEASHRDRREDLHSRAEELGRQEKALRDKQKSPEAREATLEARIRRYVIL